MHIRRTLLDALPFLLVALVAPLAEPSSGEGFALEGRTAPSESDASPGLDVAAPSGGGGTSLSGTGSLPGQFEGVPVITASCGDGSDGNAIATIYHDGSVECTGPRGIVGALDAGDVYAAGSSNPASCDSPVFYTSASTVRHYNEVGPITLPPGTYRPVFGFAEEYVGRPFEWRINKLVGIGNPWVFYQGSVRALVRRGPERRVVSAFRRRVNSDGAGYLDIANQELNATESDFGLIRSQFTAEYYLYIEASASPCAWAQVGGQVAFERLN